MSVDCGADVCWYNDVSGGDVSDKPMDYNEHNGIMLAF